MFAVATNRDRRNEFYNKGYLSYPGDSVEPFPMAEFQSENYYFNKGWLAAHHESNERADAINRFAKNQQLALEREKVLHELAGHLRTLGFTVPNSNY